MPHICQVLNIRTKTIVPAFEITYSLVAWEWLEKLGGGQESQWTVGVQCDIRITMF